MLKNRFYIWTVVILSGKTYNQSWRWQHEVNLSENSGRICACPNLCDF